MIPAFWSENPTADNTAELLKNATQKKKRVCRLLHDLLYQVSHFSVHERRWHEDRTVHKDLDSLPAGEFLCYLRLMPVAFVLFCNRQQK